MRVGKRLIAAMTVLSLVPILIIATVVNVHMQSSINLVQKRSMESLASVVSAHIYGFCNAQKMDSLFSSEIKAYQQCLLAYKQKEEKRSFYWGTEVKELFKNTTVVNDNIDGGSLIDADGTIILSHDESQEGKSVKNSNMYHEVMGGKEFYRSVVINEDGSRNLNMVTPVKDEDGIIIGMLKRIVNLSNINLYIDEVDIGESGYIYVVDENATLIYHGAEDKKDLAVAEFQDREELDELIEEVEKGKLKKKVGTLRYDNRGVETVAAYHQVPELSWVVLVAMDSEEIQKPVDETIRTILVISLLVGLLTAIICYFVVQSMLLPIIDMHERIKRIVEGNYIVEANREEDREMGNIFESVNDMAYKFSKCESDVKWAQQRDTLTGLYDRVNAVNYMKERLHKERKQAFLFLDLDGFGTINENVGQDVADEILVEVAKKLKDLPETVCCAGRFEGDQFVLMICAWDEKMPLNY